MRLHIAEIFNFEAIKIVFLDFVTVADLEEMMGVEVQTNG